MSCCSSCGFKVCKCGCGFTELSGPAIDRTLIASLGPCVDSIRDIATCLGARPYHVSLLWTRWSGGERGVGVEEVVRREKVLPTPLIEDLNRLQSVLLGVGTDEAGVLKVREISPRFTENLLVGIADNGAPIPDDQSFYWEIFFPRASGPGERRRFIPKSAPSYWATKFQWTVDLTRVSQDRSYSGEPT